MWTVRGDRRLPGDDIVVRCDERPGWVWTAAFGAQHFVVMIGASVAVSLLAGFPPTTTLLVSGAGTLVFGLVTKNRVPGVLGASSLLVAPLVAARDDGATPSMLLGGVVVVGLLVVTVGVAVKALGVRMLEAALPPVVTGAIVLMLVTTVAPHVVTAVVDHPVPGLGCAAVVLVASLLGGGLTWVSVLLGVLAGWAGVFVADRVDPTALTRLRESSWFGVPETVLPQVHLSVVPVVLPAAILLVAIQVGSIKSLEAATGRNLDGHIGDALIGGGLATTVAGCSGAPAMATSVSNVGVVAATRVHSTVACTVAGGAAVAASFSPKTVALFGTIPPAVLGGAGVVLLAKVAITGARIWTESRVEFTDPANVITLGTALVASAGNVTLVLGDVEIVGLVWGSAGIVFGYPVVRRLVRAGRRNRRW
ncbi:nitrate reductase [Allosaccharopolyspora coralli]|uniref:Nitrate reductase n=1 Tax=Allosaccharopolyspora coralli TaxID=2665642 RepID=A0A5Q3Q963_9PSEU|nr:solute carrier family 23 protein [Allosaccharopolyspora coralli]QGK70913.1 nitrate reductase [Allosaccharopolyspora coralli]